MASNVDLFPNYLQNDLDEVNKELEIPNLSDIKLAVHKEKKRVLEKFIKLFQELQILDSK